LPELSGDWVQYVLKIVLLLPALAIAATPVEDSVPPLKLSYELTWPLAAIDASERAVLRVEWQAIQSAGREKEAIDELLTRVHRANEACDDIRRLLVALPDALPAAPMAIAAPTGAADTAIAAAPPVASVASEEGDLPLLPIGAGAFTLIGGWWAWTRRQRRQMAETVIASTIMMPEREERPRSPPPPEPEEALATWPPEPDPSVGPSTVSGETAHQMADTLVAIGLNEGAARSLEHHIRSHPARALSHWLRLLDLYRQLGLHAEFVQAAERLCRQFNIAYPEWQPSEDREHHLSLETFPHVRARLCDLWPGGECGTYLQHLLDDNREGTRLGFDRAVIEEILLLQVVLKERQAGLSMSTN
jgi:hypothetical protein